jgi:hypothetical protein
VQTLVGTEPAESAEEPPSPGGRVYQAGARPDQRPPFVTPDRLAAASTVFVLVAVTAFVIWQLHPMTLLFTNTMDAGGDNAGHIAAPYYLIHDLLVHGQVSGWDPNWFDGFPLYVFYFPLPAFLVAIFNLVMPYAVAFKLVTVSGTILMPGAAYLFGRLAMFKRPIPALMAASTLPFLWNTSYTIAGGNIASTMAGEFSFTLAMTFGLVFLGLVANGLQTGRYRGLTALMFACTILCHVVPAIFFALAAVAFAAATLDWRRLKFLVPAGATGALLAGFWLIPFGAYLPYSSSMNYSPVTNIFQELFPPSYIWVLTVAAIGCAAAVLARKREAIALAVLAAGAAGAFWLLPSGQVYNERWVPFWFLTAALLAAYGFGEVISLLGEWLEFERWRETVGALLGSLATLVVVAIPVGLLGIFHIAVTPTSVVPGWISWNYSGFQSKEGWNVYQGIVNMLTNEAKTHGCGRLEYEYTGDPLTDQFGSTLAFMSLPMWTNDCIDTTEGLYFESATTTPFHFLDQSEISTVPSDPVVGIPYDQYNVADGLTHLQLMGVHYLLAGTTTTQRAAAADPALQYLASTPGVPSTGTSDGKVVPVATDWKLYLIKDSPLVAPLSFEPVVENLPLASTYIANAPPSSNWLNLGITWYQTESDWPVEIVRGGPASWPHAPAGTLVPPAGGIPVQPTTVSDITTTDESISFNVSKVGVPVMVKIPYFPNWVASGAEGPWESTPNLMVVVPTSHHVTLTYGTSTVDWAGYAASIVGVGLAVSFKFLPPVVFEPKRRRHRRGRGSDSGDEPLDDFAGPPTLLVPAVPPLDDGLVEPGATAGPPTELVPPVNWGPPGGPPVEIGPPPESQPTDTVGAPTETTVETEAGTTVDGATEAVAEAEAEAETEAETEAGIAGETGTSDAEETS